ncbi:MAG: hypothetical protein WCJ29_05955 [bacterium]
MSALEAEPAKRYHRSRNRSTSHHSGLSLERRIKAELEVQGARIRSSLVLDRKKATDCVIYALGEERINHVAVQITFAHMNPLKLLDFMMSRVPGGKEISLFAIGNTSVRNRELVPANTAGFIIEAAKTLQYGPHISDEATVLTLRETANRPRLLPAHEYLDELIREIAGMPLERGVITAHKPSSFTVRMENALEFESAVPNVFDRRLRTAIGWNAEGLDAIIGLPVIFRVSRKGWAVCVEAVDCPESDQILGPKRKHPNPGVEIIHGLIAAAEEKMRRA